MRRGPAPLEALGGRAANVGLVWVWVSLPWATFGLEVRDGRVVDAAPIARWCIGKPEREVAAYWRRRGAVFERAAPPALSP